MNKLYIVRHGKTKWNELKLLQGKTDIELDEEGINQAKEVAKQIDLEKSEAVDFVIDEEKKALYLPFVAIPSLGDVVAKSIVAAREKGAFTSKKDFELRTSVNKTQFAKLYTLGVFDKLQDEDKFL